MAEDRVVVAARYAGTVDVLVALLREAGHSIHRAAAEDRDGADKVERVLRFAVATRACVVTVLSPSDGTVARLQLLTDRTTPVVAVSWHPADERPEVQPLEPLIISAGRIRQDLAAAVTAARAT